MAERKGVMLAKILTDKLLKQLPEQVYFQPKLDGMRCKAIVYNNKVALLSSSAAEITSVPHINDEIWRLAEVTMNYNFTLDGELYIHGMPLGKIISITRRTVNRHINYKDIKYRAYDTVSFLSQSERISILKFYGLYMSKLSDIISTVETDKANKIFWKEYLQNYLDEGYEGIIIRNPNGLYEEKRSSNLLKLKPTNKNSATILYGNEAIDKNGEPKDMLGSLFLQADNSTVFKCGCGKLDHSTRIDYWNRRDELPGRIAKYKYTVLTEDGIPRECVLLEIEGM